MIKVHSQILLVLLLMLQCSCVYVTTSSISCGQKVLTIPNGAASSTTAITYGSTRTAPVWITYGVVSMDVKVKPLFEYYLRAVSITATGFTMNTTLGSSTEIMQISIYYLAHDQSYIPIMAQHSLSVAAAYLSTNMSISTDSNSRQSDFQYDFGATGRQYSEDDEDPDLVVFLQGCKLDSNGSQINLRLQADFRDPTVYRIKLRAMKVTNVQAVLYGVLVFDSKLIKPVESFYKGINNAISNVYNGLNITTLAAHNSGYIVLGLSAFNMTDGEQPIFNFNPTTLSFSGTGNFISLQINYWSIGCFNGYEMLSNASCGEKCGDGRRYSDSCDDGNTVSGDGCSSTCQIEPGWTCTGGTISPSTCSISCSAGFNFNSSSHSCQEICGDSKKIVSECDDGNTDSGDGCSSTCLIEPGYVCTGGSPTSRSFCCLDGYSYNSSTTSCKEVCGDGRQFVLECDDGDLDDGDGCSSTCQVQPGWTCSGGSTTTPATCSSLCNIGYSYNTTSNDCQEICGDGKKFVLTCDDNNTVSGDGCSSTCSVETGWTCSGGSSSSSSTCTSICSAGYQFNVSDSNCYEICGDGKQFVLDCDDNNTVDGDGCSSTCSVEAGWTCSSGSSSTKSTCTSICSAGYIYNSSSSSCNEFCGDGKLYVLQCDDGNNLDGDGCSSTCTLEPGFDCTAGTPTLATFCHVTCSTGYIWNTGASACQEVCGDGFRYVLQCDDGNTDNGDGCSASCQTESGYTCQGGNQTSASVCRLTCQQGYAYPNLSSTVCDEICGDGRVYVLPCDDGNTNNGDGCSSICQLQPGFNCTVGTPTTATSCTAIVNPVVYNLSIVFIEKEQSQNSVVFTFAMQPIIDELSSVDFNSLISCNISSVKVHATYQGNGRLDVQLIYSQTLQNETVGLTLDMASSGVGYFNNALPLVGSFVVLPDNNIPAVYYSQEVYQSTNTIQVLTTVTSVLALVGLLLSLISRKYIGVEMMGVVQISCLAIVLIEYWSPSMSPLSKMKEVNGFNVALDSQRVEMLTGASRQLCGIDIGANFVYSFNISTVILMLPYLAALIFCILARTWKSRSDQMKKWAWDSLCAFGLTTVTFCMLEWTASFWPFVTLTKSIRMPIFVYNIVDLVLSVVLMVPVVVLYLKYSKQFCEYRTSFSTNRPSQIHFIMVLLARFLLTTTLVLGHSFKYAGFICCVIPILMTVFVLVRKPYLQRLDNYRAVTNEILTLALLVIYTYVAVFSHHSHSSSLIIPYAILSLLLLCIVLNVSYLLCKTVSDLRQKKQKAVKEEATSKQRQNEETMMKDQLKKKAMDMFGEKQEKQLVNRSDRQTQRSIFRPYEIRGRDETIIMDMAYEQTKKPNIKEQLNDVLLRKNTIADPHPIRKGSMSPTKAPQLPQKPFLSPRKTTLPPPKSIAEYKKMFLKN